MTVKVKRIAGALTLVIPDEVAAAAGISDNTELSLTATATGGVVARKKPKYTLEELVAKITPENRHELVDFGPPMGNEVW